MASADNHRPTPFGTLLRLYRLGFHWSDWARCWVRITTTCDMPEGAISRIDVVDAIVHPDAIVPGQDYVVWWEGDVDILATVGRMVDIAASGVQGHVHFYVDWHGEEVVDGQYLPAVRQFDQVARPLNDDGDAGPELWLIEESKAAAIADGLSD